MPVPILLYVDADALLSISSSGLKQLLSLFQAYCSHNDLSINEEKTKILVFSKTWKPLHWVINNHSIEQVKIFKYLGITFHSQLQWSTHRNLTIASVSHLLGAIAKFHHNSGNQYVPAVLHIFKSKLISRLLYGVPIWIKATLNKVDQLAASFYRRILGVPNAIKLSTLTLEMGIHLPSTVAWVLTFKFWLRLFFQNWSRLSSYSSS